MIVCLVIVLIEVLIYIMSDYSIYMAQDITGLFMQ